MLAALGEHNRQGDQSSVRSKSDPTSSKEDTSSTNASPETADDGVDSEASDDDSPSIFTRNHSSRETSSMSSSTPEYKTAKKSHRRTRISSACLECKKRRRKCTGELPCQTCTTFQAECVYDRNMDRRSKAYFTKQLNDGVREAMEADNMEGVLSMLHQNNHYDSVSSELQTALTENAAVSTYSVQGTPPTPEQSEKFRVCSAYCGLGTAVPTKSPWWSRDARERQEALLNGPRHKMLPYAIEDDSPLSLTFSNFKDAVQHMLAQGAQFDDVLGPIEPEVDLLFRNRSLNDPFTAGTWACEVARIYACIDVYTQLANVFLLSRFMRWIISPTVENWIMLPDIMKPTTAQCRIPHYASADLYSLPVIRDSLIRGETTLRGDFGRPAANGVRMHWPFGLEQAVDKCPNTGATKISRLFAECASDTKYWSCSQDYLEHFPEVKEYLNVIRHDHRWDQVLEQ